MANCRLHHGSSLDDTFSLEGVVFKSFHWFRGLTKEEDNNQHGVGLPSTMGDPSLGIEVVVESSVCYDPGWDGMILS